MAGEREGLGWNRDSNKVRDALPGEATLQNTEFLGGRLNCHLQYDKVHNKALLCLLNNAISKTGPAGPSSVIPGLLSSCWSGDTKKDLGKCTIVPEQGRVAGP